MGTWIKPIHYSRSGRGVIVECMLQNPPRFCAVWGEVTCRRCLKHKPGLTKGA